MESEMSKKKTLIILAILVVSILMLVVFAGPTFEKDETIWLAKSHLVNPRDYGYHWIRQQSDSCFLRIGRATIAKIGNDRNWVRVIQEDCSGWIHVGSLNKLPSP